MGKASVLSENVGAVRLDKCWMSDNEPFLILLTAFLVSTLREFLMSVFALNHAHQPYSDLDYPKRNAESKHFFQGQSDFFIPWGSSQEVLPKWIRIVLYIIFTLLRLKHVMLRNVHVNWFVEEKQCSSPCLCAGRQDFSLSDLTESILTF